MNTTRVPLDTITANHSDIWTGTVKDKPEVRGYLRVRAGSPLATEALELHLERMGLVYGGDGSNEIEGDDGTLWIPLHELWRDDDPRWFLTAAAEAALTIR